MSPEKIRKQILNIQRKLLLNEYLILLLPKRHRKDIFQKFYSKKLNFVISTKKNFNSLFRQFISPQILAFKTTVYKINYFIPININLIVIVILRILIERRTLTIYEQNHNEVYQQENWTSILLRPLLDFLKTRKGVILITITVRLVKGFPMNTLEFVTHRIINLLLFCSPDKRCVKNSLI